MESRALGCGITSRINSFMNSLKRQERGSQKLKGFKIVPEHFFAQVSEDIFLIFTKLLNPAWN